PLPAAQCFFRAIVVTLAATLLSAPDARAQGAAVPEYSVKAAFLLNIAKYATWPPHSFLDASAPIVIGILGDDPFGVVLDRVVSGRVINDRRVIVRRAKRAAELRGAHVVFVAASESDRAAGICAGLAENGTLCVGDTESTAALTAINFSLENGRIVFSVNLTAARRSNVVISSKLLHLAKTVTGKPVGERSPP
ncbi:MAG: YfiR family protein, partial [Chthoniobacteraceae bacterium]